MTETRWLDDREQHAWRSYLAMTTQLPSRLNRELQADAGLSLSDFEVIVHLADRRDARARVSELAEALQWEKSRLSHHLDRMQRRGLIVREDCPDDARGAFAVLTDTGRTILEGAAPAHAATVRDLIFDHLSPEQVEALDTITATVLARLAETATG